MGFRRFIRQAADVKPSRRQLEWFDTEFYAFVHFTVNQYTNREWGLGNEDEAIFDPVDLDPDQWCDALLSAGMKGLILTAKHHDGFCLWPSKYTEHCVKNSPCKVDVVKEVSDACRRHGLKFGVYLSPWDRNSKYYGTPAYNDYFCNQLEELLTGYGDLFCVWFDNACGEGPNGIKQEYDFPRYIELIRRLQPNAVIFNDYGPDTRWVGNEAGVTRHAEWAVVPSELCKWSEVQTQAGPFEGRLSYMYNPDPDIGSLQNIIYSKGLVFCPAETNMSIRPGWFYHPNEEPHSLDRLFKTYLASVGGNSCFNLNIPPMPNGRFDERDVARLKELGDKIRSTFANDIAGDAVITRRTFSDTQEDIILTWDKPVTINSVVIKEDISKGQRVENFQLRQRGDDVRVNVIYNGTTIGHKKICMLDKPCQTDQLTLNITSSRAEPCILPIEVY